MKHAIVVLFIFALADAVDLAEREDIQRIDITEGETLSLTCKARPTLLRSYRWVYIREGTRKPRVLSSGRRLVVGEPRLSIEAQPRDDYVALILTFEEIRPYEAGLFMCWRQGLKPDPQVYVRVLEYGAEEAEPLSIEINAPNHVKFGGSATVSCLIRPSWPGKVLWLRDGSEIAPVDPTYTQIVEEKEGGELLASLSIKTIRKGANFTCRVPTSPPAEASFHLVVKVARIESLTSDPLKDAIAYGENLSLTCLVSGADPEQMLWLKNGNNLEVGKNYNGMQKFDELLPNGSLKSTLFIEPFSRKDNGQYSCYVPGDSKEILVNIEGRPPKLLKVEGWDFVVGEVLRLTCSTQYVKNEKRVTWLFEGDKLRSDWWAEEVVREDVHNITRHDLSLPIPTRAHVGTYTCKTDYGNASTEVREIVPPYVEESPPVRVNIPEGGTLSLPCSVAGYPLPNVSWEKNIGGHWKIVEEARTEEEEEVMGIQVKTEKATEGEKVVGERQELMIKEILPIHKGTYRCRGYNEKDTVMVETQVTIIEAAATILGMAAEEVTEGENMLIKCAVKNWDEPVKFIHGLKVLGLDDDPKYTIEVDFSEEDKEEAEEKQKVAYTKRKEKVITYALVVQDASVDDEGFYECHAGPDASDSIAVKVKQAPPEVFEVAAAPAVEGGELFVSCSIANMPTEEKAVFYFDGRNLNEEKNSRYTVHLAELTDERVVNTKGRAKIATYVLKVNPVFVNDSGAYHCVVGSETRRSILVVVEELENIETVHLEASSTWVGGDLVLQCTVTNWEGDVSFLQNSTLLLSEEDSRFYLSKKAENNSIVYTLNIFDVTSQDSGLYQCFTSPVMSSETNVTIQDLENLEITMHQEPKESPLWAGSVTILDCSIKGFGGLSHTIEFSHQGRPYLYFDPSKKGAQVNARATLIEDTEGEASESTISYKMKLENVDKSDVGSWVCRATIPEAGFVLEGIVTIEVFEPPHFVESPGAEISVEEDSDVVLNCTASGFPLPKLSWHRLESGEALMNATEHAQLLVPSFSKNDTGVYVCEANTLNQTISTETKLEIKKYVKITEAPDAQLILPKYSAVELRCAAVGSDTPNINWFKMNSDKLLASGHDEAVYTISELTEADAGNYVCKAESAGAEAVEQHTEIVLDTRTSSQTQPPSTTLAPTLVAGKLVKITGPDTVEEGKSATLMCLVSPLLAYYKFIIVFNDTILTYGETLVHNDPRFSITTGTGGVGERLLRLTIQNVSASDAGNYECTVNTSPIARHIQRLHVVPLGHTTSTTPLAPLISEIIPLESFTQDYKTTTPKHFSKESTSDFWDTDTPFVFSDTLTTTPQPIQIDVTSITTERVVIDSIISEITTKLPSSAVHVLRPNFEEESIPTEIDERKYIVKTVKRGERVVLHCTIYTEAQIPIMWKKDSTGTLLFADNFRVQNDVRFSIDVVDVFDERIRDLIISNATLGDSGLYMCFLQSNPPIINYVELHVVDKDISEMTITYDKEVESGKGSLTYEIGEDEDKKEDDSSEEEMDLIREEEQIPDKKEELDGEVRVSETATSGQEEKEEKAEDDDIRDIIAEVEEKEMEEHGMEGMGEPEAESDIHEEDKEISEEDKIKILLDIEEKDKDEDLHETEEEAEKGITIDDKSKNETKEEEKNPDEGHHLFAEYNGEGLTDDYVNITEQTTSHVDRVTEATAPHSSKGTTSKEIDVDDFSTSVPFTDSNYSYNVEGENVQEENKTHEYDTEYELKEYEIEDYDLLPKIMNTSIPPPLVVEGSSGTTVTPTTSATLNATDIIFTIIDTASTDPLDDYLTSTSPSILEVGKSKEIVEKTRVLEKGPEENIKEREENETYISLIEKDKTGDNKEEDDEEEKDPVAVAEDDDDDDDDAADDTGKKGDKASHYDYDYDYDHTTTKPTTIAKKPTTTVTKKPTTIKAKTTTQSPIPSHPIIVGNPGEDVKAPPEAEVILPCPTNATSEDITWKDSEKLLFLGSLDLAGVKGLALSPEGALRLLPGISATKQDKSYTCFVYDYNTYEDAPVMTYWVEISAGEPQIKSSQGTANDLVNQTTPSSPTSTYEFPGLEWQEVAVISNSEISGKSLVEVLLEGGINARLATKETCRRSKEIKGWNEAQESIKQCEFESRASGLLRSGQSVFIIIDFTVRLPTEKLYGSTLIYVHNAATNIKAHVFGPLVPFPAEGNGSTAVECGSPMFSSQTQGLDIAAFCKSSVASTILTLQETYLSHSRKLPMA